MAEQVFVSWSGGKDSCLAAYLAMKQGFEIRYLANTVDEDGLHSRSHGLSAEVLKLQSQSLGIPLVQQPTGARTYEADFRRLLRNLKGEGIVGGVYGDIDFVPHIDWMERVSRECGIVPHFPLRDMSQEKIMSDFIGLGFEAIVVATHPELLGKEWIGRSVNADFLRSLAKLDKKITPCGEAGEYHTLVVDGPMFKKRLEILEANRVLRGGHWYLNIKDIKLAKDLSSGSHFERRRPGKDILIRPLEQHDIDVISSAFTSLGWRGKSAMLFERYLAEQGQGEWVVLVAYCEGEFAGYGTIRWHSEYAPFAERNIPEIADLNVLPFFRRRGVATQIVDEAERRIFERSDIAGIGFGMYADYGAAQRMYVLRGYVPDGRGLCYKAQPVIPGTEALVDDALVLYLTKERGGGGT